MTVACE